MTTMPSDSRPLRVTLIQPAGYQHAGALGELAETLIYGLAQLSIEFQFNLNDITPGCQHILLGAHLLDEVQAKLMPPDTIIYNTEQFDTQSGWLKPHYLALLKRCHVWDYSETNINAMRQYGICNTKFVPVGYVPQLTRIPQTTAQDIDVLFYGAINERRKVILEGLIAKGLRIEFLSGVYREARDQYIARAKVVLNMHYYDASIFETVRVSYLLANEKAVVAECNAQTTIEPLMRDAIRAVPYDKLIDACAELVANANTRSNLARCGFETFASRSAANIFAEALGVSPLPLPLPFPKLLNLGSGKDWRPNCLNVDINPNVNPDALLDIGQALGAETTLETERFGNITLTDNTLDAIFANDVLEHIPDLITAMSNCLRLLKPGGTFHIYVPYDLSLGAWQDPTHIRAFNENSWLYYTDWYWYMNWTEARFEKLALDFRLSEFGQSLKTDGKSLEEIVRTPRAVDGMSVVLRKRYLQESEIERSQQTFAHHH